MNSNIFDVPETSITESLFFFAIGKQQKINNELGEIEGIFYQNPVIIVFKLSP